MITATLILKVFGPSFRLSLELGSPTPILIFYDIAFRRLTTTDHEITACCIAIMNRANPKLIKVMEFMVNRCVGETVYAIAKKLGQESFDYC